MTASVRNLRNTLLMGACVAPFYFLTGPAAAQNNNSNETVVVTGTRVQGMTAADSAAPITVLGSSALTQASGSSDLRLALGQTVPSFTAESSGSDLARLTITAALRGLSANDTLVLVNSKRRHGTGNLNVSSGAGFAGGAADLRLADVLRLPGTTRSSSRTEKPSEAREGSPPLGSMRLSPRLAMRRPSSPRAEGVRAEG